MAQITITVPNENTQEFLTRVKRAKPVPRDDKGNAKFTDMQWMKELGRVYFVQLANRGKKLLLLDAGNVDSGDLIT